LDTWLDSRSLLGCIFSDFFLLDFTQIYIYLVSLIIIFQRTWCYKIEKTITSFSYQGGPMRSASARLFKINQVTLTGVLFFFLLVPTAAFSDILVSAEANVTNTVNYKETSPRLGEDVSSELVVFTSQHIIPGEGDGLGEIMYQRLNADGTTMGSAVMVSTGGTDDKFNDISGNLIVYTAFVAKYSQVGTLKLYDITDGSTVDITTSAETLREVRIDGDYVVWIQGSASMISWRLTS
jgi:hypothetical protein